MVKYTYTINKKGIIMKREFAVIGLGRFGGSICEELSIEGMDVLAIDINQQKINEKAQNDYHEKILQRIATDHVVHPERDMGSRLAHSLISSNILDYLELSEDHSMVEVKAGKNLVGKTLIELDIRANYGCNVVAIRRGKQMNVSPSAEDKLREDDVLVVIGADVDIYKFEKNLII